MLKYRFAFLVNKCFFAVTVSILAGSRDPPAFYEDNDHRCHPFSECYPKIPVSSAEGSSRTAPAPSPKMIQVALIGIINNSAHFINTTTNTFLYLPLSINAAPVSSENKKPEQAALTSKPPGIFCTYFIRNNI
jgi:hypothetical protein